MNRCTNEARKSVNQTKTQQKYKARGRESERTRGKTLEQRRERALPGSTAAQSHYYSFSFIYFFSEQAKVSPGAHCGVCIKGH
jgi:hypothetical protein